MSTKTYRHLCDKCGEKAVIPLEGPAKGLCAKCFAEGPPLPKTTNVVINVVNYSGYLIDAKVSITEEDEETNITVILTDGSKLDGSTHN